MILFEQELQFDAGYAVACQSQNNLKYQELDLCQCINEGVFQFQQLDVLWIVFMLYDHFYLYANIIFVKIYYFVTYYVLM